MDIRPDYVPQGPRVLRVFGLGRAQGPIPTAS